jgi:drug/metabolite transporter (DMT)-like permease
VPDLTAARRVLPSVPLAVRPWLGGTMISFSGVWIRLADTEPLRSAFLRGAYALPLLLALLVADRRRTEAATRTAGAGATARWVLPLGVAAGLFLGLDLIAWHASLAIVGAGLGAVFPNLQVLFVGLAGMLLFHERPRRGFWVALPVVVAGISILGVVGRPVSVTASFRLGVVYGVVTAVTYAAALIVVRIARARTPEGNGVVVVFSMTLGATIVTGLVAATQGLAAPAGWPADGWLLLLAVGSQTVGWLLVTSSIAHLPAALTSVALLIQPALGMMWGRVILDEPIGRAQVAGAAVLLAGIAIAQRALIDAVPSPVGDRPGQPA